MRLRVLSRRSPRTCPRSRARSASSDRRRTSRMTSRQDQGGCPFSSASLEAGEPRRGLQPGRRDLLMGLAGGAIGLGVGSQARATPAGTLAPGDDGTQDSQPFYGVHQSGVTTPQPAAALIVCFDALAEDRAGLERMFRPPAKGSFFLLKGGGGGA